MQKSLKKGAKGARVKKRKGKTLWSTIRKKLKGKPKKKRVKRKPKKVRRATKLLWADVRRVLAIGKKNLRRIPTACSEVLNEASSQIRRVLTPQPSCKDLSLQPARSLPSRMPHQDFPFQLVQYTDRNGNTRGVGQRVQKMNILSFPTNLDPTGHGEVTEAGNVLKFTFSGGEMGEPFHCQDENNSMFDLVPRMQYDRVLGFTMILTMIFPAIPDLMAVFQLQSQLGELPQSTSAKWTQKRYCMKWTSLVSKPAIGG